MNNQTRCVRYLVFFCVISFFLTLTTGFSFNWFRKSDMTRATPEGLYRKGYEDYQNGSYKKAIASFERLRDEYPMSELAILAKLGIADAHYSDKAYVEAEAAYGDFIYLHPTNENLPYVMYQLGMCHYQQMSSIDRDQAETVKAVQEFEKLLARFPNSKFALMAEKMVRECRARIAEHEFYVGEFYFKQKKYEAALSRFETVAREYPNLGLDYKVSIYLQETREQMRLAAAEKAGEKKVKEKKK